jgi:hypothetical protein
MSERVLVALPARLSKGIFSSERVFEVKLANGKSYISVAPRHFCWNAEGQLLGETEAEDKEIPGFIAARVVEELDDSQWAVEVPDGEVLAVKKADMRPRPTRITPPRASNPV